MLLGLHCGDALGATLEFKEGRPFGDFQKDIIGGGTFNWNPGDPTDDTDLAFYLLKNIAKFKKFHPEEYAKDLVT